MTFQYRIQQGDRQPHQMLDVNQVWPKSVQGFKPIVVQAGMAKGRQEALCGRQWASSSGKDCDPGFGALAEEWRTLVGAIEDGGIVTLPLKCLGQRLSVQLGAADELRQVLVDQIQDAHRQTADSFASRR